MSDWNNDETIDSLACAHLLHCDTVERVHGLAKSGWLPGLKLGSHGCFFGARSFKRFTKRPCWRLSGSAARASGESRTQNGREVPRDGYDGDC